MKKTSVWVRDLGDDLQVLKTRPIVLEGWVEIWARWGVADYATVEEIDAGAQMAIPGVAGKFSTDDDAIEVETWRRLLRQASWFTVKRKGGRVDQKLFETYIEQLDPKVARALVQPVTEDIFITHAEAQEIYKQCVSLFGSAGGVAFPNPYIKKFCEYQLFWEKFGLTPEELRKTPMKEFLRLKRIAHIEIERQQYEKEAGKYAQRNPAKAGRR